VPVEQLDLVPPPVAPSAPIEVAAHSPAAAASTGAAAPPAVPVVLERVVLRRGLPRTSTGEPWPPSGFGLLPAAMEDDPVETAVATETAQTTVDGPKDAASAPAARSARGRLPTAPARATPSRPSAARSVDPTAVLAKVGRTVRRFPVPVLVGVVALAGALFMFAEWLTGTRVVTEFLTRYPGVYALPAGADVGFPSWVRWSHFFNAFFIVLIIRSGLQVRYEKKPPAYWTPRWPWAGGKISISLWLHQALDVLWLLNGLAFVSIMFLTDHWMRIVPTSWAVFPNALSALLQYVSLDWPTESDWVAYNSLQQLAYFAVVFVAAPLAALTGVRMSGLWPASARRLSRAYPVEVARAVHFPTMIFFVAFVIMHVAMVFATGALRNLNHMFAGTESTSWTGFWVFTGGLAVIALAWEFARPVLLAPVANLLGRVTQR